MKLKLSKKEAAEVAWTLSRAIENVARERRPVMAAILARLEELGVVPPPKDPHRCHVCGKPCRHMHCYGCWDKPCSVCRERRAKYL
jgi:hypothetical protein